MTKLHAMIALRDGVQSRAHQAISALHTLTKKPELYNGVVRTYRPIQEEGGEQLPPESTNVQLRADKVLGDMTKILTPYWNLMATQDRANQEARADVVVTDATGVERTILSDVSVSHLLFLEKQLDDVRTFIRKLPTLDPAQTWNPDEASDLQATPPVETVRQKKVPRNHVKAVATERHPAQVEMYYEDVLAGYWTTIKFSGALPATKIRELVERVNKISDAVKKARQRANEVDVVDVQTGKPVFDYIMGN